MIQVRKIVFPTDFKRGSEQALDYALLLARQFEAELDMLHAVVLHEADPQNPEHRFPEEASLLKRLFEVADSALARQIDHREPQPVRVRQERRRGFSASEEILAYAHEVDADLIVMGTHGHRGPERFFLGSVAESVIRRATCPVLTVRYAEHDRKLEAIDEIVVPIDFSDPCSEALRAAKEVAQTFQASLQLLHVIDVHAVPLFYGRAPMADVGEQLRGRAIEQMAELFTHVGGPEVPFESFVSTGSPAAQIAEFAQEHETDLVVISTHGLGGIERWMLGSTTERVARLASCPVLTVRP